MKITSLFWHLGFATLVVFGSPGKSGAEGTDTIGYAGINLGLQPDAAVGALIKAGCSPAAEEFAPLQEPTALCERSAVLQHIEMRLDAAGRIYDMVMQFKVPVPELSTDKLTQKFGTPEIISDKVRSWHTPNKRCYISVADGVPSRPSVTFIDVELRRGYYKALAKPDQFLAGRKPTQVFLKPDLQSRVIGRLAPGSEMAFLEIPDAKNPTWFKVKGFFVINCDEWQYRSFQLSRECVKGYESTESGWIHKPTLVDAPEGEPPRLGQVRPDFLFPLMTFRKAEAWCKRHGMRLLTSKEIAPMDIDEGTYWIQGELQDNAAHVVVFAFDPKAKQHVRSHVAMDIKYFAGVVCK